MAVAGYYQGWWGHEELVSIQNGTDMCIILVKTPDSPKFLVLTKGDQALLFKYNGTSGDYKLYTVDQPCPNWIHNATIHPVHTEKP